MKRTILCLLALLLLFASCLPGCTKGEEKETRGQETTAPVPETEEIGMKEQNGVRYYTVPDAVRKNTDIRVTLLPEGSGGEAGIFFGYENPDALFGYTGYLISLTKNTLRFCFVSSSLRELAAAKVTGLKKGSTPTLGVKLKGGACGAYLYNGSEGEDWPLLELSVNESDEFVIGYADLGREEVPCRDLTVSYPEEAGKTDTYVNPVMEHFADPDIWYEDGTYYLYGTGGEGYLVYSSQDLVNWSRAGTAAEFGLWGIPNRYWAPDVEKIGDKYYMVCSCNENLGIAEADSPLGPFRAMGESVLFPRSIDGHLFVDDDGTVYLFFVSWDNRPYGIYGVRLNANMKPATSPKLIVKPDQPWEQNTSNVTEGPYMLKHNGTYYLTYSGSDYQDALYAVGYATSSKPLGEFTKYAGDPVMVGNSQIHGTGHHCFVTLPDGQLMIVYHCHNTVTEVQERKICIDRARFIKNGNGKDILQIYGPTVTPQPYPLPKRK